MHKVNFKLSNQKKEKIPRSERMYKWISVELHIYYVLSEPSKIGASFS